MNQNPLYAIEIHSVTLWEPTQVLPILQVMRRWGYNALVLHQNDLLDTCTQLGLAANYGVSDLRLKKVRNNVAWLNRLVAELKDFDARLFLEIKEPSLHDYALEFYPGLLGDNGRPDPLRPDWPVFCRKKTEDLLDRVPDIGGLILNLSSPESRVSMPDHLAATGGATGISGWFDAMIAAFHEPLSVAGKDLYVRDFSYTTDMQSEVLAAVARTGGGVGVSAKVTAHDYFPEFPENPGVRKASQPLILEFEAFGEHMGWGVVPNCRVAEFRERMFGYRDMGANGLLMRVSWEAITGVTALDSLSAVNVYAPPRLAEGDCDAGLLVLNWLESSFGVVGETAKRAADLLIQSWRIPAAMYWDGKVFPRHSCLPSTWREGWLSMETSGMGRRDHDAPFDMTNAQLDEAARRRLFADKEAATALANDLAERARVLAPSLPAELARQFEAFEWAPIIARQFELAIKATFYAARGDAADETALSEIRIELEDLADDLERKLAEAGDLPHHHLVLFDPEQIRLFMNSLPDTLPQRS